MFCRCRFLFVYYVNTLIFSKKVMVLIYCEIIMLIYSDIPLYNWSHLPSDKFRKTRSNQF